MTWAKVNVGTTLEYGRGNAGPIPPNPEDYWAQVDVWIPSHTLDDVASAPFGGFTAALLTINSVLGFPTTITLLQAHDTNWGSPGPPNWVWYSPEGGSFSPGPAPNTPYTLQVHYVNSTNSADWYVNGTHLFHQTGLSNSSGTAWIWDLGGGNRACCEIYYFSNFKVGTSAGAGDIFDWDFSSGLGGWKAKAIGPGGTTSSPFVAFVDTPTDDACPSITVSPVRGQPGSPLTISGSDFLPDEPLQLTLGFAGTPIEEFTAVSDGSGSFTQTLTVPEGIGTNYPTGGFDLRVSDALANVACAKFFICGPRAADGISTAVPSKLADAGSYPFNTDQLVDYIFHNGAHWILWVNPQVGADAGVFPPPPADVAMYATQVSADGSSVTTYDIDWDPAWNFGSGNGNDPGLFDSRDCHGTTVGSPNWTLQFFFSSWAKPVYDAHFASDGANLWVGVVTAETVPYPWLDNLDAHGMNPGSAAQFVPLAALTSGFTGFATDADSGYLRVYTDTDGAINIYQDQAFPVSDAGDQDSGYWTTPCLLMFAFDGAFNKIGQISAKYCPGQTRGQQHATAGILGTPRLVNVAPRGSLFSRLGICASPTDPGRCHVVWSEGGDWGRMGEADESCRRFTWDGGPRNKSYRTNYTTWASSGKLTDTELAESNFDRTQNFPLAFSGDTDTFPTGYTWPDQTNFAGILTFDLRNDNPAGTPYLFICPPTILTNSYIPVASNDGVFAPPPAYFDTYGNPQRDNSLVYSDTLHVYDLGSGSAVLAQSLELSTLAPNETEFEYLYQGATLTLPVGPADAVFSPTQLFVDRFSGAQASQFGPIDKAFGISLPYEDPELGVPVYLVHLPLIKTFIPGGSPLQLNGGLAVVRGFYRVPCDMSGPFDFLDGDRQPEFTLVRGFGFNHDDTFQSNNFFSDPGNIWIPTAPAAFAGNPGAWFDRICKSVWESFAAAWTPFASSYAPPSASPGFYYDPASDSISYAAITTAAGPITTLSVYVQYICRGCRNCSCGNGVHIAHRF